MNFILFFLGGIFLLTIHDEFIHRPWLWLLPALLLTFHASLPRLKVALGEKALFFSSLMFTGAFLIANFFLNDNQDAVALLATFAAIWSLKKQRLDAWMISSSFMIWISPIHILLLGLLLLNFTDKNTQKKYGSALIACTAGTAWVIFFFTNNTPSGWSGDVLPILKLSDSPAFWSVLQSFYSTKWVLLFPYYQRIAIGMIVAIACLIAFNKMLSLRNVSLILSAILMALYAFPFQTSTWFLIGAFSLIWLLKSELPTDEPSVDWLWYSFLATRIYLLISLIPHGTDVVYYRKIAERIFNGETPYLNFSVEYPPLALLPITAAELANRLIGQMNFDSFRLYHSLIYLLMEVAFFAFLRKLQKAGKISQASVWLYIFGGLILGDLLYDRLDLIFAMTLAMSIYWMSEKNFLKAAAFIYMGIFFKLVSVVLLPLLLILIISSEKEFKEKAQQLGMITAMGLALILICQGLFGNSYLNFLSYHIARGIQIESLWATLAFVVSPIYLKADYGAIHLYYASPQFLMLTMVAPILALSFTYTTIWLRRAQLNSSSVRNWSFLITLIFIVFGKVFSPQFMIWLLCIYPLGENACSHTQRALNYTVMIATMSITWYCYRNYGDLLKLDMVAWCSLLARNLSLLTWQLILTWKSSLTNERFLDSQIHLPLAPQPAALAYPERE